MSTHVIILYCITRLLYYFACLSAGYWTGEVVGSLIVHEKPTVENVVNLLGALLLTVSCGVILSVYY